jgi:hypothetical protein
MALQPQNGETRPFHPSVYAFARWLCIGEAHGPINASKMMCLIDGSKFNLKMPIANVPDDQNFRYFSKSMHIF